MKLNTKTIFASLAAAAIALTASCKTDGKAAADHGHEHADGDEHAHVDGEKHEDHAGHDHAKGAHDDHADHSKCEVQIGPNGGRMLANTGAEFLITADGEIKLFFLNDKKEVVAPTVDSLTVLLGANEVELKKEGNVYASAAMKDKLTGKATVKTKTGDKSETDKFEVSLETCGECKNAEYKCTCHKH